MLSPNVIPRPYSGHKLAFIPGTSETVAQFHGTLKHTAGLPHFSFRELKS